MTHEVPDFVIDQRVGVGPPKTTTTKVADVFDTRHDHDWLNPNAMVVLQEAVKKRKKTVVLNDVTYTVEYDNFFTSKLFGARESVRLKRVDGHLAPFGYIPVKRILDFDYEAAQEDMKRKGKK